MTGIRSFSYSSLNKYASCPLQYYFGYINKCQPVTLDFTGTVPGNIGHKLSEDFFKKKKETGEVDFALFQDKFNEVFDKYIYSKNVFLNDKAFAKSVEEARTLVRLWVDNMVVMLQMHEVIQNYTLSEYRFGSWQRPLKITETLYLTGGADVFSSVDSKSPGRLIDYKFTDVIFHINPKQTMLYAKALNIALGLETRMAGFFLIKSMKPVWESVTREKLKSAVDWAEHIASCVAQEKFSPTPSKLACRLCAFREVCEHSSITETKDTLLLSSSKLASVDTSLIDSSIPEM